MNMLLCQNLLFPTTPEQFLADLKEFCPDIKTNTFNPGDIAYISKEGVRIDQQSSDFVRILDDDSDKIIFKPVMEVTPIISTVSDSETNNNEMQVVEDYIQGAYIDLLSASDKLDGWRHWQTLYQLEVFDASGGSESWNIDFREKKINR